MSDRTIKCLDFSAVFFFLFLITTFATAATYYVDTSGSDSNSDTSISAPFHTIQRCASLAVSGDTCYVREGTYRETVTPASSGVTFMPYNGESVTISGADPIFGWSPYNSSIYRTDASWDLGRGNNQLFVDGQAMVYARWPNMGLDLSHPTWATARDMDTSGGYYGIIDSNLTMPDGYWNGGTLMFGNNYGSTFSALPISNYVTGKVSMASDGSYDPGAGRATIYWLTDKLAALDSSGEWFMDFSGVYLWTPYSDDPSNHYVELKHRLYAFDLSGRSNITVKGFNIFAAGILTDANSSNILIDGISAKYVSQFYTTGWHGPQDKGILLAGFNDTIQNSEIVYSAGAGVVLQGTNHRVINNTIHDVNYLGSDAGAVYIDSDTRDGSPYGGPNSGHEISYNTIYNSGRSLIVHPKAQNIRSSITIYTTPCCRRMTEGQLIHTVPTAQERK